MRGRQMTRWPVEKVDVLAKLHLQEAHRRERYLPVHYHPSFNQSTCIFCLIWLTKWGANGHKQRQAFANQFNMLVMMAIQWTCYVWKVHPTLNFHLQSTVFTSSWVARLFLFNQTSHQ